MNLEHAFKITIYRAVNELITNILKHSKSKTGDIHISLINEKIVINVQDHGIGFNIDEIKNNSNYGFGLRSISERIENFEGKMTIGSKPGAGTFIQLTAPVSITRDLI